MQEKSMAGGIHKRGKRWHLRWAVPARYKSVDDRREIHLSLKTDSETEARKRAESAMEALVEEMEARLSGDDQRLVEVKFKETVAFAEARGVSYKRAQELLSGPVDGLVEAVLRAKEEDPKAAKRQIADAFLGTAHEPVVMLSALPALIEEISQHDNRFKNSAQMRKWRNGNLKAIREIVAAIGDKPAIGFTREDANEHRNLLRRRVDKREITAATAKKSMTYATGVLKRFYEDLGKAYPAFYAGLTIRDRFAEEKSKKPLPDDWVRDVLLNEEKMKGLNEQARDIMLVILETGCRQSEIYNLTAEFIHLDAPIPHIDLKNVEGEREVKNKSAKRQIPLMGVALSAMRRNPTGFPRYRGKDNFSAAVNKYMKENKLWPGDGYTIGGLRHSWEARAKSAGYSNEDRAYLMGHSVAIARGRPVYGSEDELPTKMDMMKDFVFDVVDPWE